MIGARVIKFLIDNVWIRAQMFAVFPELFIALQNFVQINFDDRCSTSKNHVAAVAWIKLGRETDPSLRAKETVAEGRRIAQGSAWFVDVPWHEWLERPLEDVRRDLRIARPVEYHPIASSEFDATLFGRRQKDPSKAA